MQTTQNKKLITSPSGMATTEGRKQNKTNPATKKCDTTTSDQNRLWNETGKSGRGKNFFFLFLLLRLTLGRTTTDSWLLCIHILCFPPPLILPPLWFPPHPLLYVRRSRFCRPAPRPGPYSAEAAAFATQTRPVQVTILCALVCRACMCVLL